MTAVARLGIGATLFAFQVVIAGAAQYALVNDKNREPYRTDAESVPVVADQRQTSSGLQIKLTKKHREPDDRQCGGKHRCITSTMVVIGYPCSHE